jgi:hypothetical protein
MRRALIQVWKTPTKQYPISAGVLMEGFWRVNTALGEGRFDTFNAGALRGPSAGPETSFVVPSPQHPRARVLIGPGVTLEIVVEGVATTIEILHLIVFFEAANDDGHSVPHSPNQNIGWAVRFARRYEFSKTSAGARSAWNLAFRRGLVERLKNSVCYNI